MSLDCPNISLRQGSKGENVTELQNRLKSLGYYTRQVDGDFGYYTKKAVQDFQRKYSLLVDGWVGPVTCKKLNEVYNSTVSSTTNTDSTVSTAMDMVFGLTPQQHIISGKLTLLDSRVEFMVESDDTTDTSNSNNTDTTTFITTKEGEPKKPVKQTIIGAHTKNEISYNSDGEGLTEEATVKTLYTYDRYIKLQKLQKCTLELKKNDVNFITMDGYVNDIKLSQEDNVLWIEISVVGYTALLEQTLENYEKTDLRSNLIKDICEQVGLKSVVNTNGLVDDEFTVTSVSESSEGGSITGNDTQKRAEIFKEAATWTYAGSAGGSSHDPETAYNWVKDHKSCDCFGSTAALYYMFKHWTNYQVRDVWYTTYVPYHHTLQIYENGKWTNPDEYHQMTRNLRTTSNPNKYVYRDNDGTVYGHATTKRTDA